MAVARIHPALDRPRSSPVLVYNNNAWYGFAFGKLFNGPDIRDRQGSVFSGMSALTLAKKDEHRSCQFLVRRVWET